MSLCHTLFLNIFRRHISFSSKALSSRMYPLVSNPHFQMLIYDIKSILMGHFCSEKWPINWISWPSYVTEKRRRSLSTRNRLIPNHPKPDEYLCNCWIYNSSTCSIVMFYMKSDCVKLWEWIERANTWPKSRSFLINTLFYVRFNSCCLTVYITSKGISTVLFEQLM